MAGRARARERAHLPRRWLRRAHGVDRRGRVQHVDHRLPGDRQRSVVRRPDRRDDGAADRQRRRQSRGHRGASCRVCRPRDPRAVADSRELALRRHAARVARAQQRSRHRRDRYARVDARPARRRCDARRDHAARGRARRGARTRSRVAEDGGPGPRAARDVRRALRMGPSRRGARSTTARCRRCRRSRFTSSRTTSG